MNTIPNDVPHAIAPTGVLRVAINFGNPVLAQREAATGAPRGVSVDLANEIGRRLGLPVRFTAFDSAAKVFEAAATGALDVMFLAIDPVRAREILFTAPYVLIEGTYLVREDSPLRRVDEFDRPGLTIAVGKGAAYDLFLSRTLNHASLVRSDTSAAAVELFAGGELDAAAGVRQPLLEFAATYPGYRVIDGRFTAIEQAIATPRDRPTARAWLQDFIEEAKASGLVSAALATSGRGGVAVAPAQAHWPAF